MKVEGIKPTRTAVIVNAGGGRIGSDLLRRALRQTSLPENIRFVAVVRGKPKAYIHTTLLSSVYPYDREWMRGTPIFDEETGTIYVSNIHGAVIPIKFIEHSEHPSTLNWGKREDEQAVFIDASGVFTDPNEFNGVLGNHVAERVMVTAPLTGNEAGKYPHVVFGANEEAALSFPIISWGSCTTNGAFLPWYVLISELAGLQVHAGRVTTIHAVTNSQNPLDRSVARSKDTTTLDSVIPTTTGFAKAGGQVMKWLATAGRRIDADVHLFDPVGATAFRVPTSTGSIIDQTAVLTTRTPLTARTLRALFLKAATEGHLAGNLGFTLDPVVTTRSMMGDERTSVINGASVNVQALPTFGKDAYFVTWESFYDNEAGFTAQGWSILSYVLANLGWGYLETSRLSKWYAHFTHFDPRLNLTLASLDAKDVYTPLPGMSSLTEAEILSAIRSGGNSHVVDPRPYTETRGGRRPITFKPPAVSRQAEVAGDDYADQMGIWFEDLEMAES